MIAPGQHRLARLQVVNWGTFNGSFDLPVPRAGLLVTGPSGSGKSSLLDALASVLVQPRWLQFNAAAQEGGAADRSRSLVSYVRGAYKREADGSTGEVSTTFLRPGATWSAVGLTFDDGRGRVTTVLRLFHLPRGTTASGDLASVFCLAEEPVDLLALQAFAENGLDQRRLKAAHPSWWVHPTYSAFAPPLMPNMRSPTLNSVTAGPTAATSPASSMPAILRFGRARPVKARAKNGCPARTPQSVRVTVVA